MTSSSIGQARPQQKELGDPDLLRALATAELFPGAGSVAMHETHASWVFVAGGRALKVKKPVALGFLDYSTLSRRLRACREEVRVNRALAPDIYLGVRAIVRDLGGFRLAPEDAAEAVEYAVEMNGYREQDTFAGLIAVGCLERKDIVAVARVLADFHRSAEVVRDWGPQRALARWRQNIEELARTEHPAEWSLEASELFGDAFVKARQSELRQRALMGLARDGHGDLRCEHVLARPAVSVVDRIEFDPSLRRIDVAADLAFLTMDLEALGHRWAAHELVDAYRDCGIDPASEALRCFYAAHCALVRAKVALISASERTGAAREAQWQAAQQLWSLSQRLCWRARRPLALVICGPAASGKSVLAEELARHSELPVVSSDAVRKRLAGLEPSQPASPEHYTDDFTRATYARLARDALDALQDCGGVLVDATCRTRRSREPLLSGLRAAGATVLLVRCEIPLEIALARVERRLSQPGHVSDATPEIVERQHRDFDEPAGDGVVRLDTSLSLDAQVAELARAVDRALPVRAEDSAAKSGP